MDDDGAPGTVWQKATVAMARGDRDQWPFDAPGWGPKLIDRERTGMSAPIGTIWSDEREAMR